MNNILKNVLTLILSFVAGIIGLIVLFYPLLLLRAPLAFLLYKLKWTLALDSIIVHFVVFFAIGYAIAKWYKLTNKYLTIPFTFPIVFGLWFMYFLEPGNATSLQLFLAMLAAVMPLLAYTLGLFVKRD